MTFTSNEDAERQHGITKTDFAETRNLVWERRFKDSRDSETSPQAKQSKVGTMSTSRRLFQAHVHVFTCSSQISSWRKNAIILLSIVPRASSLADLISKSSSFSPSWTDASRFRLRTNKRTSKLHEDSTR